MRVLFYSLAFAGVLTACEASTPAVNAEGPVVTIDDVTVLAGDDWIGTLAYADYGSGKTVSIATKAVITPKPPKTLLYTISYPDEPWENSKAKIKISQNGRVFDGHEITDRRTGANGEQVFVTQHDGEDDNKPALIQMTYGVGDARFYIRKEVKFEGSDEFLQRNLYDFRR